MFNKYSKSGAPWVGAHNIPPRQNYGDTTPKLRSTAWELQSAFSPKTLGASARHPPVWSTQATPGRESLCCGEGSYSSTGESPWHPAKAGGFTFVEVMVASTIFALVFTGLCLAYGQAIRMLDGIRQNSRAEDVALSNVEYLRTRSWAQITNIVTGTQSSSNLTEAIGSSSIYTTLTILSDDPLKIGLKNAQRNLQMTPYPTSSTSESMRKATVVVSWISIGNKNMSNSLTLYITKGGMTADVY